LTKLIRCQITVFWFVILCILHNISEELPTSILRMKEFIIHHIRMEAAYCNEIFLSISQTTQYYIPELQSNSYTFECILGITVKFKGEAECKWIEDKTTKRGYEKYFENSNTVFGGTGELT